MQKIIPHLWFDKEAEEAAKFYTSIFANSTLGNTSRYTEAGQEVHHQKPGTAMTVEFTLENYSFLALNAGPLFKFTPAISFFVFCQTPAEVDALYEKLAPGGKVMMPLEKYPFSERYAWVADKFGISWQLFMGEAGKQKIMPCLLFTGSVAGKAEEAIKLYTSVFPDSSIGLLNRYGKGQGNEPENNINHGRFTLCGQEFAAMDSSLDHGFTFTEALSLLVNCESQAEIDTYWEALSAVPEAEQCGWIKDKYGVSWQIIPTVMGKLFASANGNAVMNAMLKMKKLNIAELEAAAK